MDLRGFAAALAGVFALACAFAGAFLAGVALLAALAAGAFLAAAFGAAFAGTFFATAFFAGAFFAGAFAAARVVAFAGAALAVVLALATFFVAVVLAAVFLAAAFVAGAFLVAAFLAGAFFAAADAFALAVVFFAGAFFAVAVFLAATVLVAADLRAVVVFFAAVLAVVVFLVAAFAVVFFAVVLRVAAVFALLFAFTVLVLTAAAAVLRVEEGARAGVLRLDTARVVAVSAFFTRLLAARVGVRLLAVPDALRAVVDFFAAMSICVPSAPPMFAPRLSALRKKARKLPKPLLHANRLAPLLRFDPPLEAGTLIRRYKRFLADIVDRDGRHCTIHCANTGAMTGCAEPGSRVWYSTSDNLRRKYRHTLEYVEDGDGDLICVNTLRANALVAEGLHEGRIDGFSRGESVRREVAVPGERGRFDFLVGDEGGETYIEVKSVTLKLGTGAGAFPDAVSERATRHVNALAGLAAEGHRAMLLFCVLHAGIRSVAPADHVDPAYGAALRRAIDAGVTVRAVRARMSVREMWIEGAVPFCC